MKPKEPQAPVSPTTTTPVSPTTTTPASPSTTTPSTPSTIPGQITPGTGDGYDPSGGPKYAGGINPSYKPPTADKFTDPSNPYYYTNEDWQMLLSKPSADVRIIQQKLMEAYPGFIPKTLGDKFDPNTIKYFKFALNRINQLTADTSDTFGIRGKTLDKALDVLVANPVKGGSTSLRAYQVTNADDLKAVFRQTAQSLLGRNLGEGDLNAFVAAFQQEQTRYQQQAQTGGGMVAQSPTAETFAQTNIQKDFGQEVDTRKMDRLFSIFDKVVSEGK